MTKEVKSISVQDVIIEWADTSKKFLPGHVEGQFMAEKIDAWILRQVEDFLGDLFKKGLLSTPSSSGSSLYVEEMWWEDGDLFLRTSDGRLTRYVDAWIEDLNFNSSQEGEDGSISVNFTFRPYGRELIDEIK